MLGLFSRRCCVGFVGAAPWRKAPLLAQHQQLRRNSSGARRAPPLPFQCSVCAAAFATRGELASHVTQVHGGGGRAPIVTAAVGSALGSVGDAAIGGAGRGRRFASASLRPATPSADAAVRGRFGSVGDTASPPPPPEAAPPGGVPASSSGAPVGGSRLARRAAALSSSNFSDVAGLPPPPPPGTGQPGGATAAPSHSSKRAKALTPAEADELLASCGPEDFPCEVCGRVYKSEIDLLKHHEALHPDGTIGEITSGSGGSSSPDPDILSKVAEKQRQDSAVGAQAAIRVVCDLCDNATRIFTSESALFSHILTKHPTYDAQHKCRELIEASRALRTFQCPFCIRQFASETALLAHVAGKHPAEAAAAKADARGSGATGNATAVGGILSNPLPVLDPGAKNRWWCNECEKGFASNRALLAHLQNKHGRPTESHACKACRRVFPDVYSLKDHVTLSHKRVDPATVEGEVEAVCGACNRAFIDEANLAAHQKKHGHSGVQMMAGPRTEGYHEHWATSAIEPNEVEFA